jgi:hypothetical protein
MVEDIEVITIKAVAHRHLILVHLLIMVDHIVLALHLHLSATLGTTTHLVLALDSPWALPWVTA